MCLISPAGGLRSVYPADGLCAGSHVQVSVAALASVPSVSGRTQHRRPTGAAQSLASLPARCLLGEASVEGMRTMWPQSCDGAGRARPCRRTQMNVLHGMKSALSLGACGCVDGHASPPSRRGAQPLLRIADFTPKQQ